MSGCKYIKKLFILMKFSNARAATNSRNIYLKCRRKVGGHFSGMKCFVKVFCSVGHLIIQIINFSRTIP